jgi:hypothetical protein
MEVIHPRCCGIDVHKESVVACLRLQEGRRVKIEVQRFGTTTAELLRLTEWLSQAACTHVAVTGLDRRDCGNPSLHPYYGLLRPCAPHRYSCPCGDFPLELLP